MPRIHKQTRKTSNIKIHRRRSVPGTKGIATPARGRVVDKAKSGELGLQHSTQSVQDAMDIAVEKERQEMRKKAP